jgi:multidrug efflux pump subunit AcrB
VVRAPEGERKRLEDLASIALNTPDGTVPLTQVAKLSYELEEPVLWRRHRAMALTVRADVVDGIQGPYAMARLRPAVQPIVDALPPGYRIEEGGPIEQDIAEGHAPWQAIIDATVRRARPVVLTAAAAVLAMIPLTRSVFWGPMAMSIMGGLIVATVLTLLFVPALYAACFGVRQNQAGSTTGVSELVPAA